MSLIHDHSCECMKSELNLFSMPPTQTAIENSPWSEHHPIANIADSDHIEINISGVGDFYLDINSLRIHAVCKIVKEDNSDIGKTFFISSLTE